MATIQMSGYNPGTAYSITLLPPSGATYTVTNGIFSCNPEDVEIAQRAGFQVGPSENWPGARLVRMNVPVGGSFGSTITWPDGTTSTVTSGVVKVPQPWVNQAIGMGFKQI